ncbi:hypothetical protein [Xanthobacter sp. KR7-225]|uniref:hypothetical protein n=1 Tax=Xanthobacter sp. KR7-225 TaxID=3156613 RepID=UPI0032B3B635
MIHAPAVVARIALAPTVPGGAWRVTRETAADPARVLVGRTSQEAARLAPLIFNLCGAAHARAAAAALGLCDGQDAAALAREAARERARDHARAILIDWPAALGAPPDRASLGLVARPDGAAALARALAGDIGDLAAFSPAALDAWLAAGETATVRHLACLRRESDPDWGRAGLPVLAPQALADLMADGLRPAGAGRTPSVGDAGRNSPFLFETGALALLSDTPLFRALLAREGPTLFVRLLARLADALDALAMAAEAPLPAPAGVGLARAARGLLAHGARVEEGRVAAYRVLSPSAWTLAAGGLLERALAALPPGPAGARLVPLLVSAINPCVPVAIVPAEAAHA